MDLRLNIILIVGEDTGCHQGCYGDPDARTPHLDGLARDGVRFANAFSTAPVCAPSRFAMITGQHAVAAGAHHMRSDLVSPPRPFTCDLRDAGYHVNWANKTDLNFTPDEAFSDERDEAWVEQLERGKPPREPYFLYYNFFGTHESKMWPTGAAPGLEPPVSETAALPAEAEGLRVPAYLPDTPTTRWSLWRYRNNVSQQDAFVGRVRAAIERSPARDRTVLIYLADHGRGLVREKRWLYNAGIHVPMIVWAPGRQDIAPPGTVRDDLVSGVDLAPTIRCLAGIDHEQNVPKRGRVVLGDRQGAEPTCVFAARDRMDECFDRLRAARDRRYLYIRNDFPELPYAQRLNYMEVSPVTRELRERHASGCASREESLWFAPRKPEEELYDTSRDPDCVVNLAAATEHRDTLHRLRREVEEQQQAVGDLGVRTEHELVRRGVTRDLLDRYRAVSCSLPEHLRWANNTVSYDPVLVEDDV